MINMYNYVGLYMYTSKKYYTGGVFMMSDKMSQKKCTVALIALYDGAERRMTTRGHQEFLLSSKARVTCIHAIL